MTRCVRKVWSVISYRYPRVMIRYHDNNMELNNHNIHDILWVCTHIHYILYLGVPTHILHYSNLVVLKMWRYVRNDLVYYQSCTHATYHHIIYRHCPVPSSYTTNLYIIYKRLRKLDSCAMKVNDSDEISRLQLTRHIIPWIKSSASHDRDLIKTQTLQCSVLGYWRYH